MVKLMLFLTEKDKDRINRVELSRIFSFSKFPTDVKLSVRFPCSESMGK